MPIVGETRARVILHLDMNSFFASVEQAHNPSLKGIPMAVAGNPKHRRGILVTCSYEARALGIYTTMTVGEARRLCPDLVIVPPDFEKYRVASAAIFDLLRTYTDLVEPVSIDEAYIDEETKTVRIYEKKFQQTAGSADEKPQTCGFKILQFRKLFAPLGFTDVTYTYIFNDWFKQSMYKDMLDYIKSVDGCDYFFA